LLVRVAENRVGDTWPRIRTQLERIRIVEIDAPEGEIVQRTDITPAQKHILLRLKVPEPKKTREISLNSKARAVAEATMARVRSAAGILTHR